MENILHFFSNLSNIEQGIIVLVLVGIVFFFIAKKKIEKEEKEKLEKKIQRQKAESAASPGS